MPEIDQILGALALVALLLYLLPSVLGRGGSGEGRRWLQRGAILAVAMALAIAIVATVAWYAH